MHTSSEDKDAYSEDQEFLEGLSEGKDLEIPEGTAESPRFKSPLSDEELMEESLSDEVPEDPVEYLETRLVPVALRTLEVQMRTGDRSADKINAAKEALDRSRRFGKAGDGTPALNVPPEYLAKLVTAMGEIVGKAEVRDVTGIPLQSGGARGLLAESEESETVYEERLEDSE